MNEVNGGVIVDLNLRSCRGSNNVKLVERSGTCKLPAMLFWGNPRPVGAKAPIDAQVLIASRF
jgi:hypothetical protein